MLCRGDVHQTAIGLAAVEAIIGKRELVDTFHLELNRQIHPFGAMTRLAVKTSGAIICNVMSVGGILGVSAGAYFLIAYLFRWLYT